MTGGVIRLVSVLMFVTITLWVASAALVPVNEHIKDNFDLSRVNGDSTIDEVYDSVFKWTPLIVSFGMGIWMVRWYLRRESIRGPQ